MIEKVAIVALLLCVCVSRKGKKPRAEQKALIALSVSHEREREKHEHKSNANCIANIYNRMCLNVLNCNKMLEKFREYHFRFGYGYFFFFLVSVPCVHSAHFVQLTRNGNGAFVVAQIVIFSSS